MTSPLTSFRGLVLALVLAASPLPAQEYRMARIGSLQSGIAERGEIRCPDGSFIVGLGVQAGTYVEAVRLFCARPASRSTLGRPFSGPEAAGLNLTQMVPGLVSSERVVFCPTNHLLAGIIARGGEWVDRIASMRCTRYRGSTTTTVTVGMGGTGGTTSRVYCRGDDRTSKLGLQVGFWFNALDVYCVPQ